MLLKSYTISVLMVMTLFNSSLIAKNSENLTSAEASYAARNNVVPSMHFDFDDCVSFFGGSNSDYSEFTAVYTENTACTELEIINDHLYRSDSLVNTHSCAPGLDDTPAMCISALNNCTYQPGDNKSIKVDVRVIPGTDGIGSLSSISFYERAPEQFSYLEGPTGPNNYPTKYAMRVLVEGTEVFVQSEIPTTEDWTMEFFSFSGISAFTVTEETVFNIEILPYCLVGNGAVVEAWDIEDLRIIGGCNNIVGGTITTNDDTELCDAGETESTIEFNVSNEVGSNFSWVLVDSDNIILEINNTGTFDFFDLAVGVYTVFHLAYDNGLTGLTVGEELMNLEGCFDFSNPISVSNFSFEGGTLVTQDQSSEFYVCLGDDEDDIVTVELEGANGISTLYVLTDDANNILEISNGTTFDFTGVTPGTCFIYAISFGGILDGLTVGEDLTQVEGCYALSTSVIVDRNVVDGGTISFDGDSEINICGNAGSAIAVDLDNALGSNSAYLITDTDGNILDIQMTDPLDVLTINEIEIIVYHISFEDNVDNLEPGTNISQINGCFQLSNAITIFKDEVLGGILEIEGTGETTTDICLNDSVVPPVTVEVSNTMGDLTSYLVTDTSGMILLISEDNEFDFSSTPPGICLIWNISFEPGLMNFEEGNNVSDLIGCFDLSNSITVNRELFNGGTIMSANGTSGVTACVGDGVDDVIDFTVFGQMGALSSWVVTDTSGLVLEISDMGSFNFEDASAGVCFVYHLTYSDPDLLTGMNIDLDELDGCYDLSNSIAVTRQEVEGGEIEVEGSTSIALCPTDDIDSIFVTLAGNIGLNSTFILTDTSGSILIVEDDNIFDFSGLTDGEYVIWHISHYDINGLMAGNDVADLSGCFDISNPVNVTKLPVDGGSIETSDGELEVMQCVGDGVAELIEITVNDASGANLSFLVTDTLGNVLDVVNSNIFDFENAGPGVCQIWHISYTDSSTVTGMNLTLDGLVGCFDLSNPVTVIRSSVAGGSLTTSNGLTDISIIVGDGIADEIDGVLVDAEGESMAWIITDTLGQILALPDTLPFDFEGSGEGVCLLWSISYNGSIEGLEVDSLASDITGCFDLSNPVSITRVMVSGGTIMTTDSLTMLTLCAGDGMPDSVDVLLEGEQGTDFAWVITDTSGLILDLPSGPPFDFEGAGNGICQVWHLAYINTITGLDIGENIVDLVGAFDFSNSIEITRNGVNGGTIITSDSLLTVEVCSGDGEADLITALLSGEEGPESDWIVTDNNNNILMVTDTSTFDFEGVAPGTCLIYHISYFAGATGIEVDSNLADIAGCFDISNSIVVNREEIDGGILLTDMGVDTVNIIAGDGISDAFDVTLTDTVGIFSDWLITNSSGLIIGLPPGPPFDLETAGGGQCQIWHLSYNSAQTIDIGMPLDEFEGCYDLSNPITVIRDGINGGNLVTTDNETEVSICLGDMTSDSVDVILTDTMGTFSAWIITDTFGLILDLPASPPFGFDNAGPGVCQIWHIVYEGMISGLEIDSTLANLMGSFDLSNSIEVTRNEVDGGAIMTTDSLTAISVMVADGMPDLVDMILEDNLGDNSQWVITDSSGVILSLPAAPPFDFEDAGSGVCQIWHLSYTDTIVGLMVGANIDTLTGCYDFSNPVTVTRTGVNGGILTNTNFNTSITICAGDGIADPFNIFLSDTVGTNFQFLITDTTGLILGLPSGPPFDLEGAGGGICQLWNLAYENDLMGDTLGGNINNLTGTFDFSNPFTITRNGVNGGDITSDNGLTEVTITVGEGVEDSIDIVQVDFEGDSLQWIITDTLGNIMALPDAPPFLFEDAGIGVCQIWSLAYFDGLTGLAIDSNIVDLAGCFDLSNPITVIRDGIDGGVIATPEGLTNLSICVSDNMNDTIQVTLMDTIGPTSNWLIVNNSGVILDIDTGPPFVFGNTFPGSCSIYHMISDGPLMGFAEGFNISDIVGFFDLSNPIVVERDEAIGGTITTPSGLFEFMITVGEGIDDTIEVSLAGNVGDLTSWIFTDTLGNIMDIPAGPPFLFEQAGPGVCQIWAVSYAAGLSGLAIGNNISQLEGCFDFSNSITIIRDGVSGGTLTFTDGSTTTSACIGDGENDDINVILTDTMAMNYAWVLTNESGIIMGFPIGPPFNFENSPITTTTLIRHIGYDSIMPPIDNSLVGQNISIFSGNFNFSNPVSITKDIVDGGTITTNDNLMIVVGEGVIDTVELSLSSAVGDSLIFMAADTLGNILKIQNSPIFTFESAGGGVCDLYNVSFAYGISGLVVGGKIEDIEGCYALSNAITVEREGINGGFLTTNDGFLERDICISDSMDEPISVQLIDTTAPNSAWVITNLAGQIISLPISPPFTLDSLTSTCRIWHLAYETGIQGLQVGSNIADLVGVYNFSNPLDIYKNEAIGGSIVLDNGMTEAFICSGDGIPDPLNITLTGESGEFSSWVATDTFGNILLVDFDFDFDLEGLPGGVCDLMHLSLFDTLGGLTIGQPISNLTGCFDFSNAIRVFKDGVDGAEVFIGAFTQDTILCVGNNEADSVNFNTNSIFGNYQFVITDTLNVIDSVLPAPVFDFDNSPVGFCRVWGISYQGAFLGEVGDVVGVDQMADDCFDISDGFIEVEKVNSGIFCTTPVNNGDPISFSMFPVPANQNLNVDINHIPARKALVQIFNSTGKLMDSFEMEDYERKEVDISQYVNGVYYVKMHSGTRTKTDKFLIVR